MKMSADLVRGGARILFRQVFSYFPVAVAAGQGCFYGPHYKGAVPSHRIPNAFPKVPYPNHITLAVSLQRDFGGED